MKKLIYIIVVMLVIATSIPAQKKDFPKLTGPYLGQKPPGPTPELFAPGIISTEKNEHSPAIFSKDGNELFWSYHRSVRAALTNPTDALRYQ